MNSKGIDRRQFLKHAAVTCAAASAAGVWGYLYYSNEPVSKRKEKIFNFKNYKVEESSVYPKIAIVHGKDAERITRAAIDRMGGAVFERFKRLDILVGNAAMLGVLSPLGHIDPAVWERESC